MGGGYFFEMPCIDNASAVLAIMHCETKCTYTTRCYA